MGAIDSSSGLLMQFFVISPAVSWILKPGRFSKRRGFLYAVGFLVALAAITIGMGIRDQESNLYHVMGVGRDSSFSDIKRSFRARSIELHPDKNPSPTAVEDFNRLRLAFDVLGDASKRTVYDLFGEASVEKELRDVQVETLIGALSFYAVWAVLTFVLTLSEAARDARAWSFAGGVLFFVVELNLIFGGAHLPTRFFPMMTVHEFTKVLRSAFPPFVNGCRAIGGYYYHDLARENFALGVELLKSNQTILLNIRQLQGEVTSSRRRPEPTKAVKPDALPPAARKHLKMQKINSVPAAHASPATANAETPAPGEDFRNVANPEPAVQKPPAFGVPKFVYGLVLFLVLNYFF